MKTLFVALALIAGTTGASAATYYSDTADLARYAPKSQPDAKLIEAVKASKVFTNGTATYKSGLHLQGAATQDEKGTLYKAAALMMDAPGHLFYRKFSILVGGTPRKVTGVAIEKDVDLNQMHFSVNTGLLDRMVVVEDAANGVTLAFPLGVGGIDEAIMTSAYRILTPKFHGAHLQRQTVIPARGEPAYYRERPFMPITSSGGSVTGIAFHITILGDDEAQQNGLNYLVRGFESHGCMRMREKDLLEFFTIVMNGADDKLPVNVDNHVWNLGADGTRNDARAGAADIASIYPFNTSSFMRVTYFPEPPHWQRDDIPNEHLVIMDRAAGQPDFSRLGSNVLNPVSTILGDEDADLLNSAFPMP
jgi:hypothetical protein